MKYRTKSVTVEAVRWTGENVEELSEFLGCPVTVGHENRAEWSWKADGFFMYPGAWAAKSSGKEWNGYDAASMYSSWEFDMLHEPLPESTLDLEAIEARRSEYLLLFDKEATGDFGEDASDTAARLEFWDNVEDDLTDLIAEVKRSRGVPHPEWRHDTDPGPGIDETLCCETCGGSGHGACGIAQGTKETDRG